MTTLQTAECSRCHMHFRTRLGRVRAHDDMKRNRCPGSGLPAWEPLKTVWWRAAVEA